MNDNFQSGKTQAIDLDELHVEAANRPAEMQTRGEFELDKWGDDPWSTTEESRQRRRWAEDDQWAGDGEEAPQQRKEDAWEIKEEGDTGWNAPKRGDQLETDDGWDDWNNFGGGPKQLEMDQESKEFGGYRRVQAASQYAQEDDSNYADGHAQRDDIYRQKEGFGTSGIRERKGDPYANVEQPEAPMPELKPVGEDWDEAVAKSQEAPGSGGDDMLSAQIANNNAGGEDIPGVTRASIIIFQANADPVVYEVKKVTTTIGRGLDNMVILNDPYASRQHLSIHYVNGRFEVFALSADNMTSVNGYPISHVILMNGDQIEAGATRIRFVLGPITDQQMQMSAPLNGKPYHIDPPPQEVRSPKTTRKNLILLIAVVGVMVILLIVGLIVMGVSSNTPEVAPIASESENSEKSEAGDGDQAAGSEAAPLMELSKSDEAVLDTMLEGYLAGTESYRAGSSDLFMSHRVKIEIETEPAGARIYNPDGTLRGITPYSGVERAPKNHTVVLKIRLDGYKEKDVEISFDSETAREVLTLESDKPAAKPKPKHKTHKKRPQKKKTKPKRPGRRVLI